MLCIKCGEENPDGVKICGQCGEELKADLESNNLREILYKAKEFFDKKEYEKAIELCFPKQRNYPDSALLCANLAACYVKEEKLENARISIDRALRMDPNLKIAKEINDYICKKENIKASISTPKEKVKKEVESTLPNYTKYIKPGENIQSVISGLMPIHVLGGKTGVRGNLVVTDKRIFFYGSVKFLGITNEEFEEFLYGNITSVQVHTGILTDSITIRSAGGERKIDLISKGMGNSAAVLIQENIQKNKNIQEAGTRKDDEINIIDKIEKLSGLKTKGIITEEEFAKKKQELLDRL